MAKTTGRIMAIALGLAALAAAGCGGGDSSAASTAATTSTEQAAGGGGGSTGGGGGPAQTVNVSETDYKLDPSDPTVKAGSVTFKATNDGQVTHSLEIEGPGGEQDLPSDLAPGDSGQVTVDFSKPGTYEWYCPIGNHRDLGMEGTITVQ